MRAVLRGEQDASVPCGECTGCCISSYPIPLRPDDHVALVRVPAEFLRLPAVTGGGAARMGYRVDGSCPLLQSGRCTIYDDRPRTCRDYDCRIYTAAGLLPDGDRPAIQQRVREWNFEPGDEASVRDANAVRKAARFIRQHAALFPPAVRAGSATAAAVLAVQVYSVFLREEDTVSPAEMVQRVLAAARAFAAAGSE